MAAGFVQVQPDSTGKKLQSFVNTVGADSVHAEGVVLVDSTGAVIATLPVSAASLPLPTGAAADATLTGGTAKAIARGGAKGTTTAADVTSTASGANHQGADVCLYDAAGNLIDPRSIRALTATDVVTSAQGAAAAIAGGWPVKPTDGTNSQAFTTASEGKVNAPDVTSTGTMGLLNDTVALTLGGNKAACAVQIGTGPFVGTVVFEATINGTVWFQISSFGAFSGLNFQSTTVTGGSFTFMCGGFQAVRTRMSAFTSGSVTADWRAGAGPVGNQFAYARIQDPTSNGPVAGVAAKGTQASSFLGTQDAKDSGRVNIMWTAEVAGAATTEGLLTVTESRDGGATTTFTSKVVTNAKRLRIASVQIAIETLGTGTAPQRVYLRLRFNTAGAVTTASALQGTWECVNNAAVVKSGATFTADFPDGIEFAGDGTKQIGFTITFPDWVTTTATVQAKITVTGFEY